MQPTRSDRVGEVRPQPHRTGAACRTRGDHSGLSWRRAANADCRAPRQRPHTVSNRASGSPSRGLPDWPMRHARVSPRPMAQTRAPNCSRSSRRRRQWARGVWMAFPWRRRRGRRKAPSTHCWRKTAHLQRSRSWCVSTDPLVRRQSRRHRWPDLARPQTALVLSVDEKPSRMRQGGCRSLAVFDQLIHMIRFMQSLY